MDGWNTFTMAVLVLILIAQFLRWCRRNCFTLHHSATVPPPRIPPQPPRISAFISDSDLNHLLLDLNDNVHHPGDWEDVIHKTNPLCSYTAKRTHPKDGPVKYMSITVFEKCSPELLRDFYMDNDYRKMWDKTLIQHHQLSMDVHSGTEVGRTIKKFPFLAPREYILVWKVWGDQRGAFYCLSKGCEHPLAPRHNKYVRVAFHRSGWRIRQVAGRDACEIRMLHQEDAGLNVEMAKLAFAKGIWSYVCRMNDALRTYPGPGADNAGGMLIQKLPAGVEAADDDAPSAGVESSTSKSGSMKLLKNGLILVGGAICVSRGHSKLGAKVAMLYILTKLTMHTAFRSLGKPTQP